MANGGNNPMVGATVAVAVEENKNNNIKRTHHLRSYLSDVSDLVMGK